MICTNCDSYALTLLFEEYLVSNMPMKSEELANIFNVYATLAGEDFECDGCGCIIKRGESYIEDEDEFMSRIFQFMGKQIMNEIDCCEQCGQGGDIQELYPSIKSCFYDEDDDPLEIFEELNTASTIEDIMNDVFSEREDGWQPYYEEIVQYVECPHCDNGSGPNYDDKMDYGEFDIYTNVYTKRDIDQFNHDFYGDEIEEIKSQITELAKNVSFDELLMLKEDYLKNRIYAARNPIFNRLESFINKLFSEGKWYVLSKNRVVFRTRTSIVGKPLTKDELWEPPYNVASHGRYNDIGTSLFYCANNADVIKNEIALPLGHAYNIAKFIVHRSVCLFPTNYIFGGEFEGLISENVPMDKQNDLFKEQYILSNIVSAICFQVGYDGIVYRSTKDNTSIDYALFCKYTRNQDLEILDVCI